MVKLTQGSNYYNNQTGELQGTVEYDAQTGKKLAKGQTTIQPIQNDMLQSSSPMVTQPTPPPTASSGLETGIESILTSNQENNTELSKSKDKMDSGESNIASLIGQLGNSGQVKEKYFQQEGADEAKKQADEYTAQIKSEQLATRRRIEALEKNNPQGLFGGALSDEMNRIQRESTMKQADLAILQEASQNRYETAYSIAERKAEAELEPLKTQLEISKFFYENNKERFNKLEQREYETKIKSEERAYEKEEDFQKALTDIRVNIATSDAPNKMELLSKLNKVTSMDEAIQIAGKYSGDYLKVQLLKEQIATERAQRANIYSTIDARNTETSDGNYTEKQLKAITKLNQDVSKNSTYTKTTSMRNYGDNVIASLSLGSGVGDISAINQFQKVIDEGAVTRDQDVKLIQGAQSLSNTLKTKMKKLERGEQLSSELRTQMRQAVEAMYEKQVEALQKDPYISAKTKEAGLYGLGVTDTILGELGGFTQTQQSNPFSDALGQTNQQFNGTSIIQSVQPNGTINFIIPK